MERDNHFAERHFYCENSQLQICPRSAEKKKKAQLLAYYLQPHHCVSLLFPTVSKGLSHNSAEAEEGFTAVFAEAVKAS